MIYIKGYFEKNLGDDLFLKILLERYNNYKFMTLINQNQNYNSNYYKNIKFIKNNKYIRKLIRLLSLKRNTYENYLMSKNDMTIVIGGSMFMEGSKPENYDPTIPKKVCYLIGGNKSYYILGSNFGPYYSKEYYNKFYDIFSKAEDVCFREEYSYNLFKDLPNIRYASDIVFSLDTSNINITNNRKVIISVIDCDRKVNHEVKADYENKIIEMIKMFDKKDYEILLMSYCKDENDEIAIESILSKITDENLKSKVKKYCYDGNIDEALNIMADCQVIVGSRFHANILGLVLGKTIIPIAYSDKTLNVLKDMNFKGKYFDIRDMERFDIESITDEDLNYKLDVSFQKKDAQRHFEKLDKVLNEGVKNES